MHCILKDAKYNKIKILQTLSQLEWFIKKHALSDAQSENEKKMEEFLKELCKELESNIKKIEQLCLEK